MPDTAARRSHRELLTDEAEALDHELAEIDMLIVQAKQEAGRHEQKRGQAAEKLAALDPPAPRDVADLNAQLATLTRRAALMEAQVEILEGKRKTLSRFREALVRHAGAASSAPIEVDDGGQASEDHGSTRPAVLPALEPMPQMSRAVLTAQEDLRREIARAMHDGPAQSLTNIVLQAQIVERLLDKEPASARGELRLLISMVQQTLEATKSFIFDVRPMVLDDLGLVPTLRRASRERGRRAGIAIEFDSSGPDRRLPVEVESGLFRILDEALAAYLSLVPDSVVLRLDWSDRVEATLAARRAGAELAGMSSPHEPEGADLPPALAAMLDDRRAESEARAEAARSAAIPSLAPAVWREIQQRASTINATAELRDGGGTLRVTTAPDALPSAPESEPAAEG